MDFRPHAAALVTLLLCAGSPAVADTIAVEGGPGVDDSNGNRVLFLRYRADTETSLSVKPIYIELAYGHWHGNTHNHTPTLSVGGYTPLGERAFLDVTFGVGYIETEDKNLGTHPQFHIRFALGTRFGAHTLSAGWIHLSNGNKAWEWSNGPNAGENFLTLMVGRDF